MTDALKFTVKNLDKVKAYIKSVPRPAKIAAMQAFTEYVIGDESRGLRHEAQQKFVSRKKAYGTPVPGVPAGYFSMKQFRYVAAITKGFTEVPWTRQHKMAPAWTYTTTGSDWNTVRVTNNTPGVPFVYGDKQQARQPAKVGWRTVTEVITANMAGGMRAARAAVKQVLSGR